MPVYKDKNCKKQCIDDEALFRIKHKETMSNRIKFENLVSEYKNYARTKIKESSYTGKEYKINKHILPYFKGKVTSDITTKSIEKWQDKLNQLGLSTSYKNSIHACLSGIINYGVKNGYINRNPLYIVGGFVDKEAIKKEMTYWTIQEFDKFINNVDDVVYKAYFITLFFTGMRRGEAQALTWNDIKENKITINKTLTTKIKGADYKITSPKTIRSNRVIEISNVVKDELGKLKEYYRKFSNFKEEWFIFGGIRYLPDETIRRKKIEASKNYNENKETSDPKLVEIRIHNFRHSFATLLINNNVPIDIISKMLGHEKVSTTTDIYGHLYPDKQKIATNLIDELVKKCT